MKSFIPSMLLAVLVLCLPLPAFACVEGNPLCKEDKAPKKKKARSGVRCSPSNPLCGSKEETELGRVFDRQPPAGPPQPRWVPTTPTQNARDIPAPDPYSYRYTKKYQDASPLDRAYVDQMMEEQVKRWKAAREGTSNTITSSPRKKGNANIKIDKSFTRK